MATIIRMPSVLAGSEEAAIANWLVELGQSIAVGDPLAEIETEKAVVEYNSEDAGVVGRVLLEAGQSGEIGAPIAVLLADGEGEAEIDALLGGGGAAQADAHADAAPVSAPATSAPSAPDAADAAPSAAERLDAPTGSPLDAPADAAIDPDSGAPLIEADSMREAEQKAVPDVPAARETGAEAPAEPAGPSKRDGGRVFVSPIARKLARESGVDLAGLVGSGTDGRIVRRDVERAAEAPAAQPTAPQPTAPQSPATQPTSPSKAAAPAAPAASAPVAPAPSAPAPAADPGYELIPHTGMRKAIARRLTESKSTVPHFYLTAECRVDALIALRAEVNARSVVRVSLNDLVVKAVAGAFADVPEANVTWSDEGMRLHRSVDIAVAVATDGGLVTPVVRGVDQKSLTAVSSTISELVGRAKAKKLKQDELEGGSFSVSNLGMYGTVEFSAILNPPQSGILAVGAAKPQAVVVDGEIEIATVMRVTLSVDHRAVDGALAARWLAAFQERIENPLGILI